MRLTMSNVRLQVNHPVREHIQCACMMTFWSLLVRLVFARSDSDWFECMVC